MPGSNHDALERIRFTLAVKCRQCSQAGTAVWEGYRNPGSDNAQPWLVSLSREFYERLSRRKPYIVELVCNRCETVQVD